MSQWVSLLNGFAVSVFGSVLAASFCGVLETERNRRLFWRSFLALALLQGLIIAVWSAELLRQIYPLAVHLPLAALLWCLTRKGLHSVFSVLAAYLCCQLRRWIALLIVAFCGGGSQLQDAVELIVTLPLLLVLLRFGAPAIRPLGERPVKVQLTYSVIPALYYVFDYVAVVYTDLMISGDFVALEFMPFVCCLAYLIFLHYSFVTEQERGRMEQVQKNLDLQVKQSVREIGALRQSQELARRYRHDLRHHLQYVYSCIENGQEAKAMDYISGIYREIDAQKVQRYCENESVNLILSAFAERAGKAGVVMDVQGELPGAISVSDSDLCVILSNALENAIHACCPLTEKGERCTVAVQFYERDGRVFLQIRNPCGEDVRFQDGIPVSQRPDHGLGVQSICAIVQRYGGVYAFLVQDGCFVLRLSI